MAEKALKITVAKTRVKNSIFDDSITDEKNNSASSEDEGRGKWKVAKRTKKGKHCRDCNIVQNSTKTTCSKTLNKGSSDKKAAQSGLCKGSDKRQCGKPVLNDETGGIACDICMTWFHPSCQELTDDAYRVLRDAKLVWLCSYCKKKLPKLRALVRNVEDDGTGPTSTDHGNMAEMLDDKVKGLRKDQTDCQKKLEEIVLSCAARIEKSVEDSARHMMVSVVNKTEDIVAKVGQHVTGEMSMKLEKVMEIQMGRLEQVEKVVGNGIASLQKATSDNKKPVPVLSTPRTAEEVKSSVQKVVKMPEKEADEGRKKNILLHNIKESTSQDPKQRREYDEKAFQSMVSALFGGSSMMKVERMIRLGRRDEGPDGKARLLLVTLQTTDEAELIYQQRFDLKRIGLKNIYITKDLPPAEREAQRKLRQELAAKGIDKYCIFRGTVILREVRRQLTKK